MYSGFAITNRSGNLLGVHQKFNRLAYRNLRRMIEPGQGIFPSLPLILYFEGKNGPDGLKLKSTGRDEISHFYDPFDERGQKQLLDCLKRHFKDLKEALNAGNNERAAWEAAWLAHAIVDGLTPAHHYPYEQRYHAINGCRPNERVKAVDKLFVRYSACRQATDCQSPIARLIDRNWQMWGNKGLVSMHGLFEIGVALILKPLRLRKSCPTIVEQRLFAQRGLLSTFQDFASQIADHDMYGLFYRWGWTPRLCLQIKNVLAPLTIKLITLAWATAARQAVETKAVEIKSNL